MSELYALPEGWEWQEWKNIVNVKNGKHYKEVLNPNGKYPIYGSGGIMNYADEYLCNENTTIVGRKGTINSPIFVKEKFWNIDTAFGLEAIQEYLMPLYLYYFALHFNFLTLNKSTTLPSLAKSNLLKILMPLPPLQEQKRIVAKLDSLFAKIDQAIALHQQNIDEAEGFMGSILNEVFGELEGKYDEVPLFEVANVARGKSKHRPRNDKRLFGGDYPFIQTGDVRNANKYIKSYSNTYSDFGLKQSKLWDRDTICMTIAANIGDVAILDMDSCFPDSVVGIYSDINSTDFIWASLKTQDKSDKW